MIDYEALQQDAMRGLIKAVLTETAKTGLPGDHHFYVSFNTKSPGVSLSRRLREKYPQEMTIVLQHRFWGLTVFDDRFEVNLTFDGIPERLVIPFQSIRVFVDPSVRYGLQFEIADIGPEPGFSIVGEKNASSEANDPSHPSPSGAANARPAAAQRKPRTPRKLRATDRTDKDTPQIGNDEGTPPPAPADATEPVDGDALTVATRKPAAAKPAPAPAAANGTENVVSLDAFRKR